MPVPFNEQKRAKKWAIIFTIAYLILFPFLFYVSWFSLWFFSAPKASFEYALFLIFIFALPTLSIPIGLSLMWYKYSHKDYQKVIQYGLIPLVTLIIFIPLVLLLTIPLVVK